jgi:hypothetical protein
LLAGTFLAERIDHVALAMNTVRKNSDSLSKELDLRWDFRALELRLPRCVTG